MSVLLFLPLLFEGLAYIRTVIRCGSPPPTPNSYVKKASPRWLEAAHQATMSMARMSVWLQAIWLTTTVVPTAVAVTAALWGNIRYYSSNGCPSGSLMYVESFPLNVCYRTGTTPYYKMNTVTYGGTPGCSSCWRYQRILYKDARCSLLANAQATPVYRDTSATCTALANNNGVWASTTTTTFNYANTGVSTSDIDGAIRAHAYESRTCSIAPAESVLLKSSFCAGGIKALCSGSGANVYSYTDSSCGVTKYTWNYPKSTNCSYVNSTTAASVPPFPYYAGYAWASSNYQAVDVSHCNPTPLTAAQVWHHLTCPRAHLHRSVTVLLSPPCECLFRAPLF